MSDERRPRSDAQLSAGAATVSGSPAASRQPLREVTVGLEKVLYLAAIEPAFREALLRDREAAIRARGLTLQGSELAMLKLAPAPQLAASIDALDTSEASLARRGFMRAVAGAVALAAGSVLAGVRCAPADTGSRPNYDARGEGGGDGAVRGIQPDLPARDAGSPSADARANDGPMAGGIRPDGD